MTAPLPTRRRDGEGKESCLSDLVLDRLRAGELDVAQTASSRTHLAGCATCRTRLAEIEAEAQRFSTEVWIAGEARRTRRALPGRRWMAGAAAASVAVVATLLAQSWNPDRNQLKGGNGFSVVVRHADGHTEFVLPGQAVSPGEAIRFSVTPRHAGDYLVILDFDRRGAISVFEPSHGDPKPLEAGKQLLEGSVVLDDTLGPERLVALFCEQPPSMDRVRAQASNAFNAVHGDPAKLGSLGLPCREASLMIHKEAATEPHD